MLRDISSRRNRILQEQERGISVSDNGFEPKYSCCSLNCHLGSLVDYCCSCYRCYCCYCYSYRLLLLRYIITNRLLTMFTPSSPCLITVISNHCLREIGSRPRHSPSWFDATSLRYGACVSTVFFLHYLHCPGPELPTAPVEINRPDSECNVE